MELTLNKTLNRNFTKMLIGFLRHDYCHIQIFIHICLGSHCIVTTYKYVKHDSLRSFLVVQKPWTQQYKFMKLATH